MPSLPLTRLEKLRSPVAAHLLRFRGYSQGSPLPSALPPYLFLLPSSPLPVSLPPPCSLTASLCPSGTHTWCVRFLRSCDIGAPCSLCFPFPCLAPFPYHMAKNNISLLSGLTFVVSSLPCRYFSTRNHPPLWYTKLAGSVPGLRLATPPLLTHTQSTPVTVLPNCGGPPWVL